MTMKIKTSDLIGPALDWAVATARGYEIEMWHSYVYLGKPNQQIVGRGISIGERDEFGQVGYEATRPDVFVSILHEANIGVGPSEDGDIFPDKWIAAEAGSPYFFGPTPEVAVARCYVASKLGDEVEVPDELMESNQSRSLK